MKVTVARLVCRLNRRQTDTQEKQQIVKRNYSLRLVILIPACDCAVWSFACRPTASGNSSLIAAAAFAFALRDALLGDE